MRNYYLFIGALSLIVVALLITGFVIGGTPVSQRLVALDTTRLADFSALQTSIIAYYQNHVRLPEKLSDLSLPTLPTDPVTRQAYIYQPTTATSFKLCAEFATDSSKTNPSDSLRAYPISSEYTHKKGYDCVTYNIPDYVVPGVPTPAGALPQFTKGIYLKEQSSPTTKTLVVNYNNNAVITIDYSQARFLSVGGDLVELETYFLNGDLLEIYGVTTRPAYISASQIKDLSR